MLPEYHRQDITTLLNRQVEKQMCSLDVVHLVLRVAADNVAAREFYRRENYSDQFVFVSK